MGRRIFFLFLVLAVSLLNTGVAGVLFEKFDSNHSTIGFTVPIMGGLSEVTGKFTEFSVTLDYEPDDLTHSKVTVEIQAASIDTGISERDNHLLSGDFFHAAKHPVIRFESSRVEQRGNQWVAVGNLEMRGVSREVELSFSVKEQERSDDKVVIGLVATTSVNRQDFGMVWKHSGIAMFVGDEIGIEIHLLSKRADRDSAKATAEQAP